MAQVPPPDTSALGNYRKFSSSWIWRGGVPLPGRHHHLRPMRRTIIVTARPPKPRKPKAAATIVTHRPSRSDPAPPAADPEADARVRAFFARAIRPPE
jgi:hypothetical protein